MVYVYPNKLKIRSHDANQDKVSIFFFLGGLKCTGITLIKWFCISNLDMY